MIHVLRPYHSEEEYLAHERFSIDSKSMLLIDQAPLPVDTAIVFDVQLANGNKPIRAEAKVIGAVAASGDRPGGLRVRFKRFGAATKAFIDRAIAGAAGAATPPAEQTPVSIRSVPSLIPELNGAEPESAKPALANVSPPSSSATRGAPSGVHRRPVLPVAAPVNREELLQRLRARAREAARPGEAAGKQTGS